MGVQLGNTVAIAGMIAMLIKFGFNVDVDPAEIDQIISAALLLVTTIGTIISWVQNKRLVASNSILEARIAAMGAQSKQP